MNDYKCMNCQNNFKADRPTPCPRCESVKISEVVKTGRWPNSNKMLKRAQVETKGAAG